MCGMALAAGHPMVREGELHHDDMGLGLGVLRAVGVVLLSAGAAGCLVAPTYDGLGDEAPPPSPSNGSGGSGGGAGSDGSGASASAGEIPCDVAAVLEAHCDSCHAAGVPPALVTLDDWKAPSTTNPSLTMAERSVEMMLDAQDPMPPDGTAPASDVQVFSSWVAAGLPPGDCGGAGTGGAGSSPYDAEPTCSSGETWTGGDDGGALMFPGQPCNECHAAEQKKIFQIAGTVYPSAHEPDDCYGVGSGQAVVEIVDAAGTVYEATTNGTGNFTIEADGMQYPVTAKVIAGGQELAMVGEIDAADGDCNRCHNQSGAEGAPGRIILPF